MQMSNGERAEFNIAMCMVESKHWLLFSAANTTATVNLRGISPYVRSYEGLAAALTAVKVSFAGHEWVLPAGQASFNPESEPVEAPVVPAQFRGHCYDDSNCEQCVETPFLASTMGKIFGSVALVLPGAPGACIKHIYELVLHAQDAGARYACTRVW
jgi:hypothetical protein